MQGLLSITPTNANQEANSPNQNGPFIIASIRGVAVSHSGLCDTQPALSACRQAEVRPSKLYRDNTSYEKLCVIEFDEQGDIWKPAQVSAVRSLIRESARKPLLVVSIHGWHNNAHPGNGNLQSFNQLLKQLAKRANTWLDSDEQLRKLGYCYSSAPLPSVADRSQTHEGTMSFEIVGDPVEKLKGIYWTTRKTTGEVVLKLRSRERLDEFSGDLGEHPMKGK